MLSAYTKAEFLVYDIMSKINDENERYNLIKNILENINKEQLGTCLLYTSFLLYYMWSYSL